MKEPNVSIPIRRFEMPIKFEGRGGLGLIVGQTVDEEFFVIDYGDGQLRYISATAPAILEKNKVS